MTYPLASHESTDEKRALYQIHAVPFQMSNKLIESKLKGDYLVKFSDSKLFTILKVILS